MSSPTPIITPPPKKPKFSFENVTKRISTWLATVSASAAAGLAAYAVMPARAQDAFPEWTLTALGICAVGSALLVPLATSFKQKSLNQ